MQDEHNAINYIFNKYNKCVLFWHYLKWINHWSLINLATLYLNRRLGLSVKWVWNYQVKGTERVSVDVYCVFVHTTKTCFCSCTVAKNEVVRVLSAKSLACFVLLRECASSIQHPTNNFINYLSLIFRFPSLFLVLSFSLCFRFFFYSLAKLFMH